MNKLPLTQALMDELLFALEDQSGKYGLNTITGEVSPLQPGLAPLPVWDSHEGFRLMRLFADHIQNPLIRNQLHTLLESGGGVFRAFKDFLRAHSQWSRGWNAFKRQHLVGRIIAWAQGIPELDHWSIESLVPPETAEMILLQDFSLVQTQDLESLLFWKGQYQKELESALGAAKRELMGWDGQGWNPKSPLKGLVFFTATEEPAGACFWAGEVVGLWYVMAPYRGLGLGKMLLERALGAIRLSSPGAVQILAPRALVPELVEPLLEREGFRLVTGFYLKA